MDSSSTPNHVAKRAYGAGSLYSRREADGSEAWYGRWRVGGRQLKRRIGPKRAIGTRKGLTRVQAERELQRPIDSERPVLRPRLTIADTGARYLDHLEHVLERKPSTLDDYRYTLRRHYEPFFETKPLEKVSGDDLRRYIVLKKRQGPGDEDDLRPPRLPARPARQRGFVPNEPRYIERASLLVDEQESR